VREALRYAKREDLIGTGPECLVRPAPPHGKPAPRDGTPKGKKPTPARKSVKHTAKEGKSARTFGGKHQIKGKKK
jgi:hypothetical protein